MLSKHTRPFVVCEVQTMTTITLDVPEYRLPLLSSIGGQRPLVLALRLSRLPPVSNCTHAIENNPAYFGFVLINENATTR